MKIIEKVNQRLMILRNELIQHHLYCKYNLTITNTPRLTVKIGKKYYNVVYFASIDRYKVYSGYHNKVMLASNSIVAVVEFFRRERENFTRRKKKSSHTYSRK